MNRHRMILRTLASQSVAMIHPRALAVLYRAAFMDSEEVIPIGEGSQVEEPEERPPVLVLPIRGTIVHHWTDGFETWGMVTPTDWIVAALNAAAADEDVAAVVLDIDSYGGMAQGTPEAAEAIFRFREVKPIVAVANGSAYSAGYYLGAAAEKLFVTDSGGVGSIGTLQMYENVQKMLEKFGVEIEILRATLSENKARFNPFEEPTDEEREIVQRQLDMFNARFLADVERFRGLESGSVAELSEMGRTYLAAEAVERGLADGVASLADVLTEMGVRVATEEEEEEVDPLDEPAAPAAPAIGRVSIGLDVEAFQRRVRREMSEAVVSQRIASGDLPEDVEVRGIEAEARAVEDADHPLQGAGVRFNSLSQDLGGFVEEFAPDAFEESLADDDIRVIWQHDPGCVFGRVKAGTALAWADDEALQYSADPPDAQWARDAMESIRRGDVDQSSFLFVVEDKQRDQKFERRDGQLVRTVLKARLLELGPQTFPAYVDTSVAVREARAWEARQANRARVAVERERLEMRRYGEVVESPGARE